ncbi:MGMT family protein [Stenotrophomonas mori]|uniref:MGMT family protein n=1 Tax=Stenotrophomonas mori TaxID=2871096 RepID=A0ABT0SE19_9GAMM|nr:MGMT family protein [Stenotrophomonas mori]
MVVRRNAAASRAGAPAGQPAEARVRDRGTPPQGSPDAHARILAVIHGIPAGQVMGYGAVAAKAGLPGRARLVARMLAGNADPALPWHRVLRADGRVALPEGSAGWHEQCRRLRAEGVEVDRGRVRRPAPAADLDAEIWGPVDGPGGPRGGRPRR